MSKLLRKIWKSPLACSAICLAIFAPENGFAGDAFAPVPQPALDQALCDALGDGFVAVKGSNACIKINGYVSAGTDISVGGIESGQVSGPFATKSSAGIETHPSVNAKVQYVAPLGPGRLYVEVGRDSQ
jgi:hypothetical protein